MPAFITRAEAIEKGLPRYFVGRRCRRGHRAERNIRGRCVACKSTEAQRAAMCLRNKTPEARAARKAWKRTPNGRAAKCRENAAYRARQRAKS